VIRRKSYSTQALSGRFLGPALDTTHDGFFRHTKIR
jgi:hypothetical protein